ncbi:hypothetical protein GO009_17415, partial [Muricauda sp. TY007]|uniref:hypothetical protein n=1 Tax=Allomuricauda sp. TY007 TaxID=2683200 RepID=UPI0013C1CD59|nr:hypothetical protein [Muricauda sp. TY007]
EDSSVSSDSSAEVILPAAKMVKERFDSIGNGMLSSQEASQAAIDLMLQNNKLLDNRKQLYKSIAIIIGRLPEKDKKRATEMLMRKMDCTQLLVPPEDSSVSSDSSAEVILPAAKMVKERFDSIGNGMLSSQEASQAAIDLMLQNNKLLDNRKQLYKSIAIIIGRLP